MAILIDGFNLIYKFPDLEEMMYRHLLEEARTGLLEKLREYHSIKKTDIRVVFDGKKRPSYTTKSERVGTIHVYYSLDYSADYLIKQFIKKDLNPRMTTVVTSDKDIINYVKRFKARVIKSEDFADTMTREIEEYHAGSLPEKEENPEVSPEEVSFWEKLFKTRGKK